jgi:hypothetical protein
MYSILIVIVFFFLNPSSLDKENHFISGSACLGLKDINRISIMCDLRLPSGFQYEVVTFGLLPSSDFLWFLTNISGPYIRPIFRVQ